MLPIILKLSAVPVSLSDRQADSDTVTDSVTKSVSGETDQSACEVVRLTDSVTVRLNLILQQIYAEMYSPFNTFSSGSETDIVL